MPNLFRTFSARPITRHRLGLRILQIRARQDAKRSSHDLRLTLCMTDVFVALFTILVLVGCATPTPQIVKEMVIYRVIRGGSWDFSRDFPPCP